MSKKCTPLWREAHFEVNSVKNSRSRTTFGIWDVKSVARSTSPEHFWKLRCRKSARCCGANFEVKMLKPPHVRTTFGREQDVRVLVQFQLQPPLHNTNYTILHYTPLDCTTLQLQTTNYKLQLQLHYITLHYTTRTTLHYTTPHYTTLITLITLITLHSITLHYTTYTTPHHTTRH